MTAGSAAASNPIGAGDQGERQPVIVLIEVSASRSSIRLCHVANAAPLTPDTRYYYYLGCGGATQLRTAAGAPPRGPAATSPFAALYETTRQPESRVRVSEPGST